MTLKENLVFIFIWMLFVGFVSGVTASKYGVPYLFLYPEYLNQVSFKAYCILGFSCGGFIMAFNVSSYIINSFRFPFLATLERPFFTFVINNCIIPIAFLCTYIGMVIHFRTYDNTPFGTIAWHMTGFLLGVGMFLFITMMYFYLFDRNIFRVFGLSPQKSSRVNLKREKVRLGYQMEWEKVTQYPSSYTDKTWYIETYIGSNLGIRLSRGYEHYDNKMLERIFRQNHHTGAFFEIVAVASLLLLGVFRDNPHFMVPAAASVFLLFTVFVMLISAVHNWLRGWTTVAVILALFGINYMSATHWSIFSAKAYGLNYDCPPADYSYDALQKMNHDEVTIKRDQMHMQGILDLWKQWNTSPLRLEGNKPYYVIINTSGGGLRSSMWTFHVLQYLDSMFHGQVFRHAGLITGSSGGMVGAAYYRELYLRREEKYNINPDDRKYLKKISRDILNPIAFTIATNDLAFRLQQFNDGKYTYTKDRGFAFEEKLDVNTDSVLNKRLRDYRVPEEQAIIPMMLFTPTIVNDGRKLIISSQGVSFMTDYDVDSNVSYKPLTQSVEFSRMFARQDAQNLQFTSALRMSATFPYITPITALPSNPVVEAMDAGLLDNFGLEEAVKFIYSFRTWLEENTGRIIIIQIRDQYKQAAIKDNSPHNLLESFSFPINRFYGNLFPVENYKEDRMVEYMSRWYKGKINIVYFQLDNQGSDDISLSWHLTDKEKSKVIESINSKDNCNALEQIKGFLK